jgi:hypothetical protein
MFKDLKNLPINFALVVFGCFMIKVLFFEATFPDSIIVMVLGSVYGYSQYLKRFQPYNLDAEVMKDLIEVKSALSKMNLVRSQEKLETKKYF